MSKPRLFDEVVYALADYITRPTRERKRGQLALDNIDVMDLLRRFFDLAVEKAARWNPFLDHAERAPAPDSGALHGRVLFLRTAVTTSTERLAKVAAVVVDDELRARVLDVHRYLNQALVMDAARRDGLSPLSPHRIDEHADDEHADDEHADD